MPELTTRCEGAMALCTPYSLIGTLGRLTDQSTGVPRSSETAPPCEPTVGPYPGSYGGPRGMGVFL